MSRLLVVALALVALISAQTVVFPSPSNIRVNVGTIQGQIFTNSSCAAGRPVLLRPPPSVTTGGALTSASFTSASVTSGAELTSAQVTSAQVTSAQVTSAQVTSAQVTSASLTSASQITSAQVTSAQVTSAQVTSAQVTSAAVTSAPEITSAQVTSAQVTSAQVTSAQITSAQITSAQITSAQITSAQITSAQVTSAQITSAQLPSTQITSAQITTADPTTAASMKRQAGSTTSSLTTASLTTSAPANQGCQAQAYIYPVVINGQEALNVTFNVAIPQATISSFSVSINYGGVAPTVGYFVIGVSYNGRNLTAYRLFNNNNANYSVYQTETFTNNFGGQNQDVPAGSNLLFTIYYANPTGQNTTVANAGYIALDSIRGQFTEVEDTNSEATKIQSMIAVILAMILAFML